MSSNNESQVAYSVDLYFIDLTFS